MKAPVTPPAPDRSTLAARLRELDGWIWTLTAVGEETALTLRQAADALTATCAWTLDEFYGNKWDTACGHAWEFTTDGPVENQQAFCGYCGRRLIVTPPPTGTTEREE